MLLPEEMPKMLCLANIKTNSKDYFELQAYKTDEMRVNQGDYPLWLNWVDIHTYRKLQSLFTNPYNKWTKLLKTCSENAIAGQFLNICSDESL